MHRLRGLSLIVALFAFVQAGYASGFLWFGSGDPLSPRDEWGRLHQSRELNETDYAPREWWRLFYYNKSRYELARDPAYVGALQEALRRNGYYCGPTDGVYSPEITDAIAQLQKNHSMRVNGSLTVAVRRALHLP